MRSEENDATVCQSDATRQGGPAETHALVVLDRPPQSVERERSHHHAPFLAQLVATKDGHPQTRERRGAEPNVALAAYRAPAALGTV
ncbi:MAG: hypothetical protein WA445_07195 [Pseudolabrys sp.]